MAAATLPAKYNLNLYRGDDFLLAFVYGVREEGTGVSQIVSTVGWNAHAQIRKDWGKEVWLDLTVGEGLELAHVDGDLIIYLHIRSDLTEPSDWDKRDYAVWDLEVTDPDGTVTTIFAGEVNISSDVTRED